MQIECMNNLMVGQFERICHASKSIVLKSEQELVSTSKKSFKLEFEKGEVCIVAAESEDDKNENFCSVLIHPQRSDTAHALVFSNEDLDDLGMRLIGHSTMIDVSALRSGHLTDPQWPRLTESVQRLRDSRCHLVSIDGLVSSRLEEICKELADKHGAFDRVLIDSACLCTELQAVLTQCAGSKAMSKPFTKLAEQLQSPVVIFHWEPH